MKVLIDSMAHLPLKSVNEQDLFLLKRRLIMVPKANSFEPDPKPIQMYSLEKDYISIPREYFFRTWQYDYEVDWNFSDGCQLQNFEPIKLDPIRNQPELVRKMELHLKRYRENKSLGGILSAGTGTGKSIMALEIARRLGRATLIIVYKDDLADQWTERIKQFFPTARIGRIQANQLDYKDKDFVLLMLQTAISRREQFLNNPDLINYFGLTITDECLDEGTNILTPCGIKKLKDINIGDEVLTPSGGVARVKDKWLTKKKAFKYITESGRYLISSKDHIIQTVRFKNENHRRVRDSFFENVKIGESKRLALFGAVFRPHSLDRGRYLYGWYLSDGTMDAGCLKFSFKNKDKVDAIVEHLSYPKDRVSINYRGDFGINFGRSGGLIVEKFGARNGSKSTTCVIDYSLYQAIDLSVLKGLFDGDGCFNTDRVEYDTCSFVMGGQISDMLSMLGIHHTIQIINKRKKNKKHNNVFRINIFGDNIKRFNAIIGFRVAYKHDNLLQYINSKKIRTKIHEDIVSVECVGVRSLIDIELDNEEKLFVANGFVTHNCHRTGSELWGSVAPMFNSKYRLGLSATVRRKDGCENVFRYHIGNIVAKAEGTALDPDIYFLETGFKTSDDFNLDALPMATQLKIIARNVYRNKIIANKIVQAVQANRKVMILSKFIDHLQKLEGLTKAAMHVKSSQQGNESLKNKKTGFYVGALYTGETRINKKGQEVKVKATQTKEDLKNAAEADVMFATYKKAEDALDVPKLDTLFMVLPISDAEQSIGRILRLCDGKKKPLVVDVCDDNVSFCRALKRSRTALYEKKKWPMKIGK